MYAYIAILAQPPPCRGGDIGNESESSGSTCGISVIWIVTLPPLPPLEVKWNARVAYAGLSSFFVRNLFQSLVNSYSLISLVVPYESSASTERTRDHVQ